MKSSIYIQRYRKNKHKLKLSQEQQRNQNLSGSTFGFAVVQEKNFSQSSSKNEEEREENRSCLASIVICLFFIFLSPPSDWRHKILTPFPPQKKLIFFLSVKMFIFYLRYISADVLRTVSCK
jgi:hypothetical protein